MKKTIAIILTILLISCSGDFYDVMDTNNLSPVVSAPTVTSFDSEHQILIEWEPDAGAERYVLYRDTNPDGSFTTAVYEGTATSYVDTSIADETFYYYKLAKIRGKREFEKSIPVMGLSSSIQSDAYECNNTSECTIGLNDVTEANIFYYKDTSDNTVEDRDWYSVTLEPRRSMLIVFDEVSNGITGEELAEDEMKFNIKEGELNNVYNGVSYWLDNYSYSQKTIHFQVSVNKKEFGNKIACYRIKIDQIKNNQ